MDSPQAAIDSIILPFVSIRYGTAVVVTGVVEHRDGEVTGSWRQTRFAEGSEIGGTKWTLLKRPSTASYCPSFLLGMERRSWSLAWSSIATGKCLEVDGQPSLPRGLKLGEPNGLSSSGHRQHHTALRFY